MWITYAKQRWFYQYCYSLTIVYVSCGNKVNEQLTGTVILSDFQYEQRKYRYKTEEIKNLKIKVDLEFELKVSV